MVTISPERKIIDLKHPGMERQEAREAETAREAASYMPEVILEWQAYEYEHSVKSPKWFLWGSVAVAALVIIGALTRNYFFILFIAVAAFVVYLYAKRPPKEIYCAITSRGVQVGRRMFEFENLNSFWIFYEVGGIKHLSLESKKALLPRFSVPLGDADPVTLRRTLIKFVNEVEHEESLADIFARMAGF
ncbi:MAG: hypothetical protein UY75_C0021G0001 [Parcubacteria group bacterium GW2011_GWC2_52_8c]|nr:MAG: hypothetical protein UY75_C0021G0001 [Parcubacteria group bacterium GW2011_GWC2_52_8c]